MKFFAKKETIVQNLTYMALMAAINVVFIVLSTFLPYLYVLLLFILPLTSTFVTIYCKKRYFPIYAVATVLLCFLVSFNNIGDTIFYIIPSVLTGFITGLLIEKQINGVWIILFTSIIQFSLSILSLPIIKLFTSIDLMNAMFSLFFLDGFIYKNYLTGPILYFTSIAQMSLTYLILKNEIKKLGIDISTHFTKFDIILLSIYEIVMFATMFILVAVKKELTLTLLMMGIVPSIILIVFEVSKLSKIRCIFMIGVVILFPIIFGLVYPHVIKPLGFLLISILFILINIPTFCRVFQKNWQ